MILCPLTSEDARELAALLVENREFLARFEPLRDDRFFTIDAQRERIENERSEAFAILAGDRIAGTVTISNIVHGPSRAPRSVTGWQSGSEVVVSRRARSLRLSRSRWVSWGCTDSRRRR